MDTTISRRTFAKLAGVTAGLAASGASIAQTKLQSSDAICNNDGTIVDLHTHIFNALDLPVEGIFVYWCRWSKVIPDDYGRAAAAIINGIALAKSSTPGGPDDFDAMLGRAVADGEIEFWSGVFAMLAPPELAGDARVVDALRKTQGFDVDRFVTADDLETKRAGFFAIFRKFLEALPPSVFAEEELALAERERNTISAGGKWIWLMTEPEWKIASYLCRRTRDVGLYIHHLMDMENYYPKPGGPVNPALLQPARMREITRFSNGRFLPFVAFDPKKGVAQIRDALSAGCAGVKVYPPNGYHADPTAAEWASLFDYCTHNHIPILAHCTCHGFESDIHGHSGCNSSPSFWAPIAAKWPELHLCLGHAGGGAVWLPDAKDKCECQMRDFSKEALELMQKSSNVYLEVAYLNGIRKPGNAQKFRTFLLDSATKYPRLPQRLCYGTDWHMPSMFMDGADGYLKIFQDVFASITWAADFFHGNAVRYLDLKYWSARMHSQNWWTPAIEKQIAKFS